MEYNQNKISALFGHFFFIALFLFAAIFYKERMVFSDPAYFSFNLIWKEGFEIALGRWGTVFTQILPILAVKLGVPLKFVLIAYSLNFVLCFYLLYLFITRYFKDINLVFPFCVALVLTFRLTFYYPTAELYLGSFLCLLLLPIIRNRMGEVRAISYKTYLGVFGLAFVCSFFHQLTLFPFLFVLAFAIKKETFLKALPLFALAGVWFVLRVKWLSTSTYEADKLLSGSDIWYALKNFTSVSSYTYFKDQIWPWIKYFTLLPIIPAVWFFKQKDWLKLAATVLGPIAFFVVIILVLHKGESKIMLENYYSLFGLFFTLPFAFIPYPFTWAKVLRVSLATLLVLVSFVGIYRAHFTVAKRFVQTENILRAMDHKGIKRAVIADQNLDKEIYFQTWALPFESIYWSALDQFGPSKSFFPSAAVDESIQLTQDNPKTFLGPAWAPTWFSNQGMLHPNYFKMDEAPYKSLSTPLESLNDSIWGNLKSGFKVVPKGTWQQKKKLLQYGLFNFTIAYNGTVELGSLPNEEEHLQWAYYFIDPSGIRQEEIRFSNFVVDLSPSSEFSQAITIDKSKLIYQEIEAIRLDIYSPKRGFLGLNLDVPLF